MLSHSDALCFAIRFKVIFCGCGFSFSSDGLCAHGDKKKQRDSSEIKYLNLVRWKGIGSSQDCKTVSNSIWKRVRAAKISEWMSILTGIISNEYVAPTKYWTVTWPTVNSIWWLGLFYHALEWCKSFLVHQGENKRLGSSSKMFHRRWKIRKKNLNYNFGFQLPDT